MSGDSDVDMDDDDDDDYWNFSFTSQLSFGDQDDKPSDVNVETTIPSEEIFKLEDLISNNNLKLILDPPNTSPIQTITEFIQNAIFDIEYGQIEKFRKLSEKLELLDTAIALMDGNIIKYILVFLKRTLNTDLFMDVVFERKRAVSHYIQLELEIGSDWGILSRNKLDLMNSVDVMKFFEVEINEIHSVDVRIETCRQFLINFDFKHDSNYLNEYVTFLEYGKRYNILNQDVSVVSVLVNFHLDHLQSTSNKYKEFTHEFQISNKQYHWVLLNVYCNQNCWTTIINQLKTGTRFGGTTFNTKDFYPYKVINRLVSYQAPVDVLKTIIPLISNSNEITTLTKNKCGMAVTL